jgi:hypothetical protein
MTLTLPALTDWVANCGASYHTTMDASIPGSFRLHNVLVAPDIIQHLLSVLQITTNNSFSMEFHPFGLSEKDHATWTLLTRNDTSGPYTPRGFLLPLLHTLLSLYHCLRPRHSRMALLLPLHPTLGIGTLVILAKTCCPGCVVVPSSLVLRALMSICVTPTI